MRAYLLFLLCLFISCGADNSKGGSSTSSTLATKTDSSAEESADDDGDDDDGTDEDTEDETSDDATTGADGTKTSTSTSSGSKTSTKTGTGTTLALSSFLSRSQSAYQRVKMNSAGSFNSAFSIALQSGTSASQNKNPFEFYLMDSLQRELSYQRSAPGRSQLQFSVPSAGDYFVGIRNKLNEAVKVTLDELTGATGEGIANTSDSADAKFKNILFKASLGFSAACTTENSVYMTAPRNANETLNSSIKTVNAPAGEYFLQPFVFYGRVGSDKKVTPFDSATISLVVGSKKITLVKVTTLPENTLNVQASGADAFAYVRAEYGGFIGAAGQLYTLDTFRKRGNCDTAVSFPLSGDPGKDTVTLSLEDSSLGISEQIPVRVTLSAAVSVYSKDNVKQSSWDLCSYDNSTGVPYNYTKGSGARNEISVASPPSAKIVVQPSELYKNTATTASDPTRILFYGRSLSRAFMNAMVANVSKNTSDSQPKIAFTGCMFNGGQVSLPATTTQSVLPVEEFGFAKGDIFSLGTRVGSSTALSKFYQGSVDASADLVFSRNIPTNSGVTWKKITASSTSCSLNVDSGVYAAAIASYGIYPGDEGMYGVVVD